MTAPDESQFLAAPDPLPDFDVVDDQPIATTDSEIEALMATDNFSGLTAKIESLMKMPQSLCKVRGNCCRVATFKGSLSYEGIQALAASGDKDAQNAKDFVTLFEPYPSQEAVRAIAPVFVDRVRAVADGNPDEITFFKCRFLGDNGACLVHEDRPTGCRAYPFPHERTVYHPGCGFEHQGKENWAKVQTIIKYLEQRMSDLSGSDSATPD